MLPSGDQEGELVDALQRVVVEADHHHIDNDPPLDPVLPVEEVELLTVHQLEHLLGREDQRGHDQEYPHRDGGPGDPGEQKLVTTTLLMLFVKCTCIVQGRGQSSHH